MTEKAKEAIRRILWDYRITPEEYLKGVSIMCWPLDHQTGCTAVLKGSAIDRPGYPGVEKPSINTATQSR